MTTATVDRTKRDAETREYSVRNAVWAPPELLPEPEKVPGWAYRWVRTSTLGVADPMNVSSKQREGWEPVSVEDQPRLKLHESQDMRFRGNIEIGGLLLCKMPEEFVAQRAAYYGTATRSQMESVDNNFMAQNDPRMPLFADKRSKVTFGSGTK